MVDGQLIYVSFSKDKQAFFDYQLEQTIHRQLWQFEQEISLEFDTSQRYCIGWHDLETGDNHTCSSHEKLEPKYEQCRFCQEKMGFNPAFYHADSVSEAQQKRNAEPHFAYLAYFSDQDIKVGISYAERGLSRLLEQGARCAFVLDTFSSALVARQYEADIAKLEFMCENVKSDRKLQLLSQPFDAGHAKEFLTDRLHQIEAKLEIDFPKAEFYDFNQYYFAPGFDFSQLQNLIDLKDQAKISGQIKGVVGSTLICDYNGDLVALPLRKLTGYNFKLDFKQTELELPNQQFSLFWCIIKLMQALYRKYRSQSLDDIVGQRHVTDILKAELANDNLSQAYLFVGPRGVGKTSVARILAHEINGLPYKLEENHVDIIEFNAADKTSVDDIREIIDKASIAPNYAPKKVYIIDEVHMLSKAAFNAFLKILEEPPAHVVFILATTDQQKVPATIVSRTQKFTFRRISTADIVGHLRQIATAEKIDVSDEVLKSIAARSDGGLRDAINLLDQISNLTTTDQSTEVVESILGIVPAGDIDTILINYLAGDLSANIKLIDQLIDTNLQPIDIAHQLANAAKARILQQPQLINLLRDLATIDDSHNPDLRIILALSKTFVAPVASSHSPKPVEPKLATKAIPSPITTEEISDEGPDLIELCRAADPKLADLVAKAQIEFTDNQVRLKAKDNFTRSRLKAKLSQINQVLADNNLERYKLVISGDFDPKAETDTDLTAVKQLMGGGEEVQLWPIRLSALGEFHRKI